MDCRETQDRLSEFQDRALPSPEAEGVGAHLRECRKCAEIARSLAATREGLRSLPAVPAPPELMERVREEIARDGAAHGSPDATVPPRAKSSLSRLLLPLEAAAAVLLVASIWWYQKGAGPPPVTGVSPSPAWIAAPAPSKTPAAAPRHPGDAPKSTGQERRPARKVGETSSPAGGNRRSPAAEDVPGKEIASLPPGTPEPKVRAWSPADLPAAPAVRASSESSPLPKVLAAPPSRLLRPLPYGREILLDVTPDGRGEAGERIADAARRSGGSVERVERDATGQTVAAVRVLLPESASASFLSELDRIGKVPPEGKPAEIDIPAGPTPGTVAYTVRIRLR